KRCLEGEGGKPSGALARGVGAASGKKHLVFAMNFSDEMKTQMRKGLNDPQAAELLTPLLEAQGVVAQGELDSKLALELNLLFASDDKAKAATTAVEKARKLALDQFEQMKKAPNLPREM